MTRPVTVGDTVGFAIKTRNRNTGEIREIIRNKGVVKRLYRPHHLSWLRAEVKWEDKKLAFILVGNKYWAYARDLRVINAD